MLSTMSWADFAGWLGYAEVEPFGERRADLRAGQICAVIANVNRSDKSTHPPYKPSDFIIDFDAAVTKSDARKPVTDRAQWESIKSMARAMAVATSPPPKRKRDRRPLVPTP